MIVSTVYGLSSSSNVQIHWASRNPGWYYQTCSNGLIVVLDVDVDVVDLRAQADASMPASNNNVIIIQYI